MILALTQVILHVICGASYPAFPTPRRLSLAGDWKGWVRGYDLCVLACHALYAQFRYLHVRLEVYYVYMSLRQMPQLSTVETTCQPQHMATEVKGQSRHLVISGTKHNTNTQYVPSLPSPPPPPPDCYRIQYEISGENAWTGFSCDACCRPICPGNMSQNQSDHSIDIQEPVVRNGRTVPAIHSVLIAVEMAR